MRVVALLVLLCMLSGVAISQTAEQCPPTQRAGDLLGCYNGTAPPHALAKPKTSKAPTVPDKPAETEVPIAVEKPAASKTLTDQKAQYIDMVAVENKKLDAKLKTLCRGC